MKKDGDVENLMENPIMHSLTLEVYRIKKDSHLELQMERDI